MRKQCEYKKIVRTIAKALKEIIHEVCDFSKLCQCFSNYKDGVLKYSYRIITLTYIPPQIKDISPHLYAKLNAQIYKTYAKELKKTYYLFVAFLTLNSTTFCTRYQVLIDHLIDLKFNILARIANIYKKAQLEKLGKNFFICKTILVIAQLIIKFVIQITNYILENFDEEDIRLLNELFNSSYESILKYIKTRYKLLKDIEDLEILYHEFNKMYSLIIDFYIVIVINIWAIRRGRNIFYVSSSFYEIDKILDFKISKKIKEMFNNNYLVKTIMSKQSLEEIYMDDGEKGNINENEKILQEG